MLDAIHDRRPLIPTMAEIKDAVQNVRTDARTLWLPVGTIAGLFVIVAATLVGSGMWIARTGDRAASTTDLAAQLQTMNTQLATMQGSINALMGMQATLAQTSADVGALQTQLAGLDTKIQTQDAWIQRLRDDLRARGMNPPPYPLGGQ